MPRTMTAAEFKARCLELMDQVARERQPIIVTKRGKPVAQLAPVVTRPRTLRGFLKGQVRSTKGIVGPIRVRWNANRS